MFSRLIGGLLLVSAVLNGVLLWQIRERDRRTERLPAHQRLDPERLAAEPTAFAQADRPGGGGTPECQQKRAQLRAELQRETEQLRQVLRSDRLFERSTVNEVARSRLAPVVAGLLEGESSGCDHALECRDVVCRVIVPAGAGAAAQEQCLARLQKSKELRTYSREGLFFTAGPWVRDPLSGLGGYRKDAYLRLQNLEAEPIAEPARVR
jgi:hypothetical protein